MRQTKKRQPTLRALLGKTLTLKELIGADYKSPGAQFYPTGVDALGRESEVYA
jgi:hypothetical protein